MGTAITAQESIYTPFGVAVKKRLLDKGLTQKELEAAVEAPANYLTMVLRGKRAGKKYVSRIATVLEIDLTKYTA